MHKVKCYRCGRHIPATEFAAHLGTHKGKLYKKETITQPTKQAKKKKALDKLKKLTEIYSESSQAIPKCSICSKYSQLLMPYESVMLCPTCSLDYFESKEILGIPVINHMGNEYEAAFREKAHELLKYLNKKDLTELGLSLALITFSQDANAIYGISPEGEAMFVLVKHKLLEQRNLETFKNVVFHEIFHRYISQVLKLGISDKLKPPFTQTGVMAASLAEDIQLERIASSMKLEPLLLDEVNRTAAYFENLPHSIPEEKKGFLTDSMKFQMSVSVTWTYAVESWFSEMPQYDKVREIAQRNLELVFPHYKANGFPKLKETIIQLLKEKIAETGEEVNEMFEKILEIIESFVRDKG